MGERTWRELDLRADGRVPEREGCVWTPVYDYLTPGKTYRLEVEASAAPAPAPPAAAAAAPAPAAPPALVMAAAPSAPTAAAAPAEVVAAAEALGAVEAAEAPEGVEADEAPEAPAPMVAPEPPAPVAPAPAAPEWPAPGPADQTWQPEGSKRCTADGATALDRTALLPGAPAGALIAKIGGSSADTTVDKLPLFAVGRHCVFTVEAGKAGTLYLGVNDVVGSMSRLTGHLIVKLWVAL
jgi:hypothetical protein